MKILYNRFLPFKGYSAMMICGVLFVRKEATINTTLANHERIHLRQQQELLFVVFFVWYLFEYLIKLIIWRKHNKAYQNISFEREAYQNEANLTYLNKRRFWSFLKYI